MNAQIDVRQDCCFDPFAAASPSVSAVGDVGEWSPSVCLSDPGDDPFFDPDPPPES